MVSASCHFEFYDFTGIGHASSKQLQELGVVSVRDLQDTELPLLKKIFGEVAGTHMQQLAHGIDESPVLAYSLPQVSNFFIFMPQTLKKLMGHIAFGAWTPCVRACVGHTFCTYCNF